jgi:hypothetical protein
MLSPADTEPPSDSKTACIDMFPLPVDIPAAFATSANDIAISFTPYMV